MTLTAREISSFEAKTIILSPFYSQKHIFLSGKHFWGYRHFKLKVVISTCTLEAKISFSLIFGSPDTSCKVSRISTVKCISLMLLYSYRNSACINIGTQSVQEFFFCDRCIIVMIWVFLVAMYSRKETGNL